MGKINKVKSFEELKRKMDIENDNIKNLESLKELDDIAVFDSWDKLKCYFCNYFKRIYKIGDDRAMCYFNTDQFIADLIGRDDISIYGIKSEGKTTYIVEFIQ